MGARSATTGDAVDSRDEGRSQLGHQETETFNTFFETSHQLSVSHLAKMYGLTYFSATDEITLETEFSSFLHQNNAPSILEIFTPEKYNDTVLLDFFKALKK